MGGSGWKIRVWGIKQRRKVPGGGGGPREEEHPGKYYTIAHSLLRIVILVS